MAPAPDSILSQMTIGSLLTSRESMSPGHTKLFTVQEGREAAAGVEQMAKGSSGSVIVVDRADNIVGQLSERDYLLKLAHGSFAPTNVRVEELMHPGAMISCSPDSGVLQLLAHMLHSKRRHAAVLTAEAASIVASSPPSSLPVRPPIRWVSGMVSLRDIVAYSSRVLYEEEARRGESEDGLGLGMAVGSAGAQKEGGTDSRSPGALTYRSRVDDLLSAMKGRGKNVLLNARVEDNITVADAANSMAERGMSALILVDKAGSIAGLFTVRDFLKRVVSAGLNATSTPVAEVMTREIVAVPPSRSILRASRSMAKRGFRHLPVLEKESGGLLGVLSMSDAARCFLPTPMRSQEGAQGQAALQQVIQSIVPGPSKA